MISVNMEYKLWQGFLRSFLRNQGFSVKNPSVPRTIESQKCPKHGFAGAGMYSGKALPVLDVSPKYPALVHAGGRANRVL